MGDRPLGESQHAEPRRPSGALHEEEMKALEPAIPALRELLLAADRPGFEPA